MDSVRPTGTPGAAPRMASTAMRCPAIMLRATARDSSLSDLPGGNMPASQPMAATTLGSLMVQARDITSPSADATTSQKRPNRSIATPLSHPP
jgi:hypothetical protein